MGMFDTYRPKGPPKCPACGHPLTEWQGKEGPNALFVWEEGIAYPVDQPVVEECKLPLERRMQWRLPASFTIYSYDCDTHHLIYAKCKAVGDTWSVTEVMRAGWSPWLGLEK